MRSESIQIAVRLAAAINAHDLDALLACFTHDFESLQPSQPERNFHGKASVQHNWTALFQRVPRLRAELLCVAAEGSVVMVEWRWDGIQTDGAVWNQQGVTVLFTENNLICKVHLYMNSTPV